MWMTSFSTFWLIIFRYFPSVRFSNGSSIVISYPFQRFRQFFQSPDRNIFLQAASPAFWLISRWEVLCDNAFLVRRTQTARPFRVFGKIVRPMRAKKKVFWIGSSRKRRKSSSDFANVVFPRDRCGRRGNCAFFEWSKSFYSGNTFLILSNYTIIIITDGAVLFLQFCSFSVIMRQYVIVYFFQHTLMLLLLQEAIWI